MSVLYATGGRGRWLRGWGEDRPEVKRSNRDQQNAAGNDKSEPLLDPERSDTAAPSWRALIQRYAHAATVSRVSAEMPGPWLAQSYDKPGPWRGDLSPG